MKCRTAEVDGIPFISAGLYYEDGLGSLTHSMKKNNRESIRKAARMLAPLIPEGSCIIPAPGRNGYADHTLDLAKELVLLTGVECRDILKGKPRISQYQAKKSGNALTETELGLYTVSPIPKGLKPIVIDNVIGSGLTGKAAVHALGEGSVLALAMDDKFYAEYCNDNRQKTLNNETQQDLQHEDLQTHRFKRSF